MNSRERLERCIDGDVVDRTPVSLWRHFPIDDLDPFALARSVVEFQQRYQFDFVKITARSSYSTQDWGSSDRWDGNPEGSGVYTQFPVKQPEDWQKIKLHSIKSSSLSDQLECIKLVRESLPLNIPVIPTIFNPLSQAKHLAGNDLLVDHIRNYPDELLKGLSTIIEQTLLFIKECKKLKIDGIFFAVQHAQKNILTEEEFIKFGFNLDLQILKEVQDLWLNVGHIHGSQVMFDQAVKYPVSILNWHDREEDISLKYGQQHFKGAVCGGLRQWDTMAYGTPQQVKAEAADAISQTGGKRFILGTGCVLPIIAPNSNILAAVESVKGNQV